MNHSGCLVLLGGVLAAALPAYAEPPDPKDDVERRVESLLKRDSKGEARPAGEDPDAAGAEKRAEQDEVKAGVVRELVTGTTEAFETWQRRIDERVREAMQKMTPQRPDLDAMRARIEALEARIRAVEAKRKT